MDTRFGSSEPYTIGVEEEFQLVDPGSLELVPAIEKVLLARDAAGLPEGLVTSELSASCLELRTPVFGSVSGLARELPALRGTLRNLVEECGVRLMSAGAHPFSDPTGQPITGDSRYRMVEEKMGWTARMQAIYGVHIHVAVPGAEHAIRATAALSRYVPLFIALAANSPFWDGSDTGLASVRTKVFGLIPRSGLPPGFRSWREFEDYVNALIVAGSIPDYSWCWWDVRPHPGFGTVELRAPDAQTEASRTVSLVALAQCLVATAGEHAPEDPLFISENKWRAARHGLDARLHDFSNGHSASARDVARDLVKSLRPVSRDLGCEAELEGVLKITDGEAGSEVQRSVFEKRGSIEDVAGYLVRATV